MAVQQGREAFLGGAAVRGRLRLAPAHAELYPASAVLHVRRGHRTLLVPAHTEP